LFELAPSSPGDGRLSSSLFSYCCCHEGPGTAHFKRNLDEAHTHAFLRTASALWTGSDGTGCAEANPRPNGGDDAKGIRIRPETRGEFHNPLRLLFIVAFCASLLPRGTQRRTRPETTRTSWTLGRVLTAFFWGDLAYSPVLTWLLLAFQYHPRQTKSQSRETSSG
jgi:hypothetical protein